MLGIVDINAFCIGHISQIMVNSIKHIILLFCISLIVFTTISCNRSTFEEIEVKELFKTRFQFLKAGDWSPDGKQIIYFDNGLYIYDIGTQTTSGVSIDPSEHSGFRNIRWISDETIVFSRIESNQNSQNDNWQLVSFDMTTRLLDVIVSGRKPTDFCWLPTENSIAYIDDKDAVWIVNIENFESWQAYEPQHDEDIFAATFLKSVACDPTSSRFVIVEDSFSIVRPDHISIKTVDLTNDIDTIVLDQYSTARAPLNDISWSYDGKWIAERHTTGGSTSVTTINIYSADGTESFKNITDVEGAIKIEWSPTGYTMLAFSGNASESNIFKVANFAEFLK